MICYPTFLYPTPPYYTLPYNTLPYPPYKYPTAIQNTLPYPKPHPTPPTPPYRILPHHIPTLYPTLSSSTLYHIPYPTDADDAADDDDNDDDDPGGGTLIFSAYVGSDPASTVHPQKISGISSTPQKNLEFQQPK